MLSFPKTIRAVCGSLGKEEMSKKSKPYEKFDISGIVVNVFAKFILLTEEDSGHTLCKFCCDIWLCSKVITM